MINLNKLAKILLLAASALPTQAVLAQDTLEAGKKLFNESAVPACALCHRLKHADAAGEIGPVLDELRPDAAQVEKAIRNGIGQMPAFTTLSESEIKLLAKYVSEVAGK
jgi:cytochrome c6